MRKWPDITGMRFGLLTVVKQSGSTPKGQRLWVCSCDCGGTTIAKTDKLKSGRKISCGCRHGCATHGHTRGRKASLTFSSWSAMLERCKGNAYYKRKGITVCERWHQFENFLADMGERPSIEHTLDRYPDQLGNYETDNCRWATRKQQGNNRVTTRYFDYAGERFTLSELSERTGIPQERLRHRLVRAGWPIDKAVSLPISSGQRVIRKT